MGESSNTLEQRNASQANTIAKQAEQIKALKQEVADLSIWQRFVAYQISDCNMQPDILESLMGTMLAQEAAAKKAGPKRKIDPSTFTEPTYRDVDKTVGITEEGWYFFDRILGKKYGPYSSAQVANSEIKSVVAAGQ